MNNNWVCRILAPVLFSILTFSSVRAQIRLAVSGGVHSSSVTETNSISGYQNSFGRYYKPITGLELGILAELPFGKHNLFLQPGIFYSAKGNQYERFYDSILIKND